MIPIEKQTTSLEVSQKLKSLGVPQGEGYFVWFNYSSSMDKEYSESRVEVIPRIYIETLDLDEESIVCDAFTLSELLLLIDPEKQNSYLSYKPQLSYQEINIEVIALNIIIDIESKVINPQDLKL